MENLYCEACGDSVEEIMKSTGTCLSCRNEEIQNCIESGAPDSVKAEWLSTINSLIEKFNEPKY